VSVGRGDPNAKNRTRTLVVKGGSGSVGPDADPGSALGGLDLVVVLVAAIVEDAVGIDRSGLVQEGAGEVQAAVGMVHRGGGGQLALHLVVADAAVLKTGHGLSLEGWDWFPLRGVEKGALLRRIDFAGSSVVHSFGAWAGLMGAILLGPRIGKFVDGTPQAMPGHNQAIATLGCLILWLGWFGFNPGSVLAMNEQVPYIAVTTTLGGAAGGIAATLFSQFTGGKPDLSMTINGILAGLVGVTAGCDGYSMPAAWVIGFIAGILVVYSVALIDKIGIDDPVGAWSVHGTCGIWGTLAVGLFNMDKGLFTGHGFGQLGVQFVGVLAFAIFSAVTSWIVWSVIGTIFGGIRVTPAEEFEGLDIGEHGMEAYPEFASTK